MNANACISNNARIINSNIANIYTVNTCIANDVRPSVKETMPMPPFAQAARFFRRVAALTGFAGLLALAHAAARADVVVEKFVGPQQTYGVPAGTTALQLKVHNTDNYTASGLQIKTTIYSTMNLGGMRLPGGVKMAAPASAAFSLGPQQSAWITIPIPANSPQGQNLIGQYLWAAATLNNKNYTLNVFQNTPAQPDVQFTGGVTAPANRNAGTPFQVTVTNNGYVASQAQKITATLWADAEGPVSPNYTQSATVPTLAVGQSYTVTFSMPAIQTYNNTGYANIKGTIQTGKYTTNVSF